MFNDLTGLGALILAFIVALFGGHNYHMRQHEKTRKDTAETKKNLEEKIVIGVDTISEKLSKLIDVVGQTNTTLAAMSANHSNLSKRVDSLEFENKNLINEINELKVKLAKR